MRLIRLEFEIIFSEIFADDTDMRLNCLESCRCSTLKRVSIRKRKKNDVLVDQRKKAKYDLHVEKHGIKSGYGEEYVKNCNKKISERRKFLK